MAREHSSVVAGTIATVVGGLILAVLTWLFGFLPVVWAAIISGLSWVWSLATYPVALPAGGLLVAAFALFFAGRYSFGKRPANVQNDADGAGAQPASHKESAKLSQLECGVIRILAGADGAWLGIREIADQLRTSNLMVEQALEKLYANDMINDNHNYIHGTTFRLSSKGRDYAIAQGYVSGWAQLP